MARRSLARDAAFLPGSRRHSEVVAVSAAAYGDPLLNLTLLLIGLVAGLSTFAGGLVALRWKASQGIILGLSAGAILGVVTFELAPEALGELAGVPWLAWAFIGLGLIAYFGLDRCLEAMGLSGSHRAHLGPASLTVHSLLDGVAIGLGFEASPAVGASVAIAIIAHDLSDGANTVNLSLVGGSASAVAMSWLLADALAPVLGIGLTRFIALPQMMMALVIAALTGGLLYVAFRSLCDPRSGHHGHNWRFGGPVIGFVFIFLVTQLSKA